MNAQDAKNYAATALAEVIQRAMADDDSGITADRIADCAGGGVGAVYTWRDGTHAPGWDSVCALVRRCGSDQLRLAIANILLAGTGLRAVSECEPASPNLDIAMRNMNDAIVEVAELSRDVHTVASDKLVTHAEILPLVEKAEAAKRLLDCTIDGMKLAAEAKAPARSRNER